MKIALAQPNPVIGDFDKNCEKVLSFVRQAADAGCGLVVFPELVLSGTPPQNLLQRPGFLAAQKRALTQLQKAIVELDCRIDVLFGCLKATGNGKGKAYFSTAVIIRGEEIVYCEGKKRFPDCGMLDTSRSFHCDSSVSFFHIEERVFAVTLHSGAALEDSVADILVAAKNKGISLTAVIALTPSPFLLDAPFVEKSFIELCRRIETPFLYCNQAGGQGSLVFSGGSVAIDGKGRIVAQSPCFTEDLLVFDSADLEVVDGEGSSTANSGNSGEQGEPLAALHQALVVGLRDYIHKSGFSKVVLGLSGGIDSALVAALAVDALGAENVLAIALPSPYSSKESVDDAERLAHNLGCRFEIVAIGELFEHYNRTLSPLFTGYKEDVTEQNLQARIRGNLLMAVANKFGSILLNTSNKSEIAVGYGTLYGDMCGGLAVIADLPKGVVYKLAEYLNRSGERIPWNTISKPPSAELKPGQKDQDELPPYEILDQIVELYLDGCDLDAITAKGFDRLVVRDILHRIHVNEYKRMQAPPGLRVSLRSFIDRRSPLVHKFRG